VSKNYRFLSDFTRIDATAFGSVDADVPVLALPGQAADEVTFVKLRVWNIILENLTPGQFTLHHVMRLDKPLAQGAATMRAGVYDYTYQITVDANAVAPQGEPAPVKLTGDDAEMTADPVAIVKAFYAAMNGLEYEKAVAFLADDVVTINPSGTYTGTAANLAQYTAAWDAGIRLEVSSPRNVDGIVVAHVKVFDNGTLIVEADSSITIVKEGKITFDGDTFNMPLAADPTAPSAVIKAFYVALNAKEVDHAMTFVADDATLTDNTGSQQGKDEIAAHIMGADNAGRSYDIWDIRAEDDGTVSYKARVYQGDTVIYETTGSAVVKGGKITQTSTTEQ